MPRSYEIVASGGHPGQGQIMPYMRQSLAAGLPSEAPEPSLLLPIMRRWWLVLLFIMMAGAGAEFYLKKAQSRYSSIAKIYIQPTPASVGEVIGTSNDRANYLATQVEVIRSSTILNRVAEMDGIRGMKTFASAGGNPVLFLREELDVQLERKTDMLDIELQSPYPEEAKTIVQAVVDCYIRSLQDEKDDRTHQMLATYKQNQTNQQTIVDDLQKQIFEFQSKNVDVGPAVDANSAARQNANLIGSRLTELQLRLIEAQQAFGPEHINVKRIESIRDETQKLYLQALAKLQSQTDKSGQLQLLKAKLENETDLNRKLLDLIHQAEMKLSGRNLAEIDIIEPPRVSDVPSYPRKSRVRAVAMVLGGLLGAGLALLRDRADGRMRSVEEMQSIVGLPILGVVPVMSGRRTAVARAMTVHLDPRSVVAEAYRTIRTAIYFGLGGNGNNASATKTILVTSPEPGDGKTTSASNLAIAIAQTGRSVLLLDADFRKPSQHKNLEIKNAVGLSSVLAGTESLEQAVQRTGVEGLDILPCGPIPANPSEILNSREFGELVDTLASRYDHILFDSPPVNAVTDARILGAVCDATIMVLRADKSTRKSGEHARNALLAVGARMLGAIVNDASKRNGYGAYGGSYYGSTETNIVPSTRRVTAAKAQPEQYEYVDPDESRRIPPTRRRNIA